MRTAVACDPCGLKLAATALMASTVQVTKLHFPFTERFSKTIYGEVVSAWASLARSSESRSKGGLHGEWVRL